MIMRSPHFDGLLKHCVLSASFAAAPHKVSVLHQEINIKLSRSSVMIVMIVSFFVSILRSSLVSRHQIRSVSTNELHMSYLSMTGLFTIQALHKLYQLLHTTHVRV